MKIIKSLAAAAITAASLAPMASVGASSNTIDTVNLTITPPSAGTVVTEETCTSGEGDEASTYPCMRPQPTVTTTDSGYSLYANYVKCIPTVTEGPEMSACYEPLAAGTTFTAGTDYYVNINLFVDDFEIGPLFNVEWDDENEQTIDNVTVNVAGAKSFQKFGANQLGYELFATVTATAGGSSESSEDVTTYETLEGGNQTFYTASDSNLTFRFNIDYAEFQESGEVYMDGEIVNSTNYITNSGSTIITFTDSYTNSLSAGNHTLRIVTANGEASTNFTISKSANPKTGLEITSNFVLLGTSLAGLAGAALYAKKASKNA